MRIKRSLLLCLLLSAFAFTTAFAQTWCPPGAHWYYRYQGVEGIGYYELNYENDTLIHSQACKRISAIKYLSVPAPHYIDTVESGNYYTFSSGTTVYFLFDTVFRPVYYFDAQTGDTLYSYYSADSVMQQAVDSVTTITYNGYNLHGYYAHNINPPPNVSCQSHIFAVEKFGCLADILLQSYWCMTEYVASFRCYRDDSFPQYMVNPNLPCNDLEISVDKDRLSDLKIFPNPFTEEISIDGSNEVNRVEVFSLNGKLLRSISDFESSAHIRLEFPELPPALYLLVIRAGEKLYTEKLVKSEK